jgi:hypothetical protein
MANGTNIPNWKPEPKPKKPRKPLRKFQTFGKAKESHKWLARKSRIRPKSAKQAAKDRAGAKVKRAVMESGDGACEARIENVCRGRAVDPHHKVKRSAGGKDEASNLMRTCRWCHIWIENHPKLAAQRGLSITRKVAA